MDKDLDIFFEEANEGLPRIRINGVYFDELPEAPVRREPLARTTTSINMNGKIK